MASRSPAVHVTLLLWVPSHPRPTVRIVFSHDSLAESAKYFAVPSCKFSNPKNLDTIKANQNFTITMKIQGMTTGNFVNAASNYFSAPQQLDKSGKIIGHSHVVVEKLNSLKQTTPNDPTKFAFFKGLNDPAQNGELSAVVSGGLPAGTYKLSSINTAANHQPALVPVAQHGSLDDVVYVSFQPPPYFKCSNS